MKNHLNKKRSIRRTAIAGIEMLALGSILTLGTTPARAVTQVQLFNCDGSQNDLGAVTSDRRGDLTTWEVIRALGNDVIPVGANLIVPVEVGTTTDLGDPLPSTTENFTMTLDLPSLPGFVKDMMRSFLGADPVAATARFSTSISPGFSTPANTTLSNNLPGELTIPGNLDFDPPPFEMSATITQSRAAPQLGFLLRASVEMTYDYAGRTATVDGESFTVHSISYSCTGTLLRHSGKLEGAPQLTDLEVELPTVEEIYGQQVSYIALSTPLKIDLLDGYLGPLDNQPDLDNPDNIQFESYGLDFRLSASELQINGFWAGSNCFREKVVVTDLETNALGGTTKETKITRDCYPIPGTYQICNLAACSKAKLTSHYIRITTQITTVYPPECYNHPILYWGAREPYEQPTIDPASPPPPYGNICTGVLYDEHFNRVTTTVPTTTTTSTTTTSTTTTTLTADILAESLDSSAPSQRGPAVAPPTTLFTSSPATSSSSVLTSASVTSSSSTTSTTVVDTSKVTLSANPAAPVIKSPTFTG